MNITFLGTGGGRFNLIAQVRGTAGFVINGSLKIHVDPGPGVLAAAKAHRQDVTKTDIVVVTHNHIDHYNDAEVVMEAMTGGGLKRAGVLVASKSVLAGLDKFDIAVSRYHQAKMQQVITGVSGQRSSILYGGKSADFTFTPVKHDDKSGFGFVLSMDGVKIGYTSDSEHFDGLGNCFSGCDYLIANNLKSAEDGIPDHLDSNGCIRLLKVAMPKMCIITHMGMRLITGIPELEAQRIGKESGVKTVAARDGMVVGDAPAREGSQSLLDYAELEGKPNGKA